MRALRVIAGSIIGLVLVGALVAVMYDPANGYDVRGIDVAHYQGEIDWGSVAADGVAFAYIKSTEGGDWTDSRFTTNWRGASDVGIAWGAYHFYTLCTPGSTQADHFIAAVPWEKATLPPAVDLEFGGNCSARPTVREFREQLSTFLDEVRIAAGVTPVIYAPPDFYDAYLAESPPDAIWWVRFLVFEPDDDPSWVFWQVLPGRIGGIDGLVDRNAFRGSPAELWQLATP